MSKYEPLWRYVKDNNKEEYKLSFDEVAKITGFPFDHAFLSFKKELPDFHLIMHFYHSKKNYQIMVMNLKNYL